MVRLVGTASQDAVFASSQFQSQLPAFADVPEDLSIHISPGQGPWWPTPNMHLPTWKACWV